MKGITFKNVSFKYSQETKEIDLVNITIPKGSFYGITGVNGSGKTTLSLMINGLIPHHVGGVLTGNILIDGVNSRSKPVSFFSKKVGMVFQNPDFMIFNLTVEEEIAFGLSNLGMDKILERTSKALSLVGLEGFEKRDPHTLSFGQKQKLCLAAVLAMETDYIVLDEPSSMLDYKSSIHLYTLLAALHKKGKTIIIIEHDTDYLYSFADRTIVLNEGRIEIEGDSKYVFGKKELLKQLGIKIPRKI